MDLSQQPTFSHTASIWVEISYLTIRKANFWFGGICETPQCSQKTVKKATAGKAKKSCNKKKWRIEWINELELKVCNLLCMKFITNKKSRIHISHCVSPWIPGSQIKHSMRLVPVSSFQVILNHQQNWDRHSVKLGKPNVTCDIGMKWDKLLKSLGVVWKNFTQGRSLKPSENPEAFRLSRGEVLQTTPRLFNSLSDFGFLEVQGQTCPRALYGKSSRKPQWSLYTVNPRLHR